MEPGWNVSNQLICPYSSSVPTTQPELSALRQLLPDILWLGGDESSRSPLFQSLATTSDKSFQFYMLLQGCWSPRQGILLGTGV